MIGGGDFEITAILSISLSPQRRCRAVGEKPEITAETVTLTRFLSSFDLHLNLMSLSYTQAN